MADHTTVCFKMALLSELSPTRVRKQGVCRSKTYQWKATSHPELHLSLPMVSEFPWHYLRFKNFRYASNIFLENMHSYMICALSYIDVQTFIASSLHVGLYFLVDACLQAMLALMAMQFSMHWWKKNLRLLHSKHILEFSFLAYSFQLQKHLKTVATNLQFT